MRSLPEQSVLAATERRWFAAQTQPRKEKLAFEHLERQGFASFLPLVRRPLKRSGRQVFSSAPLFPGYVFVSLDLKREQWRSINGTIGVIRLVSFGDSPTALPKGFIEALIGRLNESGDCPLDAQISQGAEVRVVGGIFDDLTGTLLSSKPSDRVIVLLDLLSGPRRVSIPRSRLMGA